jgi:hypothetical protein
MFLGMVQYEEKVALGEAIEGKNSFPSKCERVFASFLVVCTSYHIGSHLWRNPNSLFSIVEKGNSLGIPRNSPGMHNLVNWCGNMLPTV